MSLQGMNHFTVLSDNLEETRKFYCDLLGFEEGPRPNFRFPGTGSMSATSRSCTSSTASS